MQGEKHRSLWHEIQIVERLALALNEEKAAEPQLFDGKKGVAKGAKGHRKTKHQLPAVHF